MDPVAKNPAARDGDVNNDGKKDKTDKYIYNRRDAINAAIAKKKAMQEELLVDGTTSTEGQNKGKITGTNVDNYSTGVVKVCLLYTSPSPRDLSTSRMPSSA